MPAPPSFGSTLSLAHRLWRLLPVRPRRALAARVAAWRVPAVVRPAPPAQAGVVVAGELGRASGLGEAARLMAAAIHGLDLPCWEADLGTPFAPMPLPLLPGTVPDGAPLLVHVNAPLLPWALGRLGRQAVAGRRVIGYWAWELPVVPSSWRVGLRFVHEVWTLSHFSAEALRGFVPPVSGIVVRVVPPPLAARPPLPSALDRAAFALPEKAVVVLVSFSLASSFARKNPEAAIAAFRAAFADRPDRLLLLKVGDPGHFPAEFAALRRMIAGAANIRLETRTLPQADAYALTACADIVLSLHRSEGFGLVPAEAMLLSRPVIATGWSGTLEFMDRESAALVGYRLVPARDPRGVFEAPGAVWAEPDIGEAAAALRALADDPVQRAALGRRGQAYARARLSSAPLKTALAALGLGGGA